MNARPALGEDNAYCFRPVPPTDTASERRNGEIKHIGPSKWALLRCAKELLPTFNRFHLCHEASAKDHPGGPAGVGIHVKGESSWFSGVIRCGSVWVCPICARRVSERRKEEVQGAIDNAIRSGNGVLLVTHTFPHGAGDVLADILPKFGKAQRASKSGRAAKALHANYGFIGEIRTLEVTHGNNGWHPHAHSIWITEKPLSQDQQKALRADLYHLWVAACARVGLPEPSDAHGVDVRGARYAGEYVAKWGFAMEITGSTSKRGKKESAGRTPWQLLAEATEGDLTAAELWQEFAHAFFGKRQLFWSRGLRAALELPPELTEQELLDLEDEHSEQVVVLSKKEWQCVRKARAQEEVLYWAIHDRREMYVLLNHLRCTVPIQEDVWVGGMLLGENEDWVT